MRRLPWAAVIHADVRGILTVVAVALGVGFAVIGFAVPAGLESETISQDGPFAHPDVAFFSPDGGPIARGDGMGGIGVLLHGAPLRDGGSILLVALEGASDQPLEDQARPREESGEAIVNLTAGPLRLENATNDPRVPRAALLVSPETLRRVAGRAPGEVDYLLVAADDARTLAAARAQGLSSGRVPAVEPFFRASALEVVRDLALVVTFSSVLIALLIFEFLRAEVRERRREIGIWRSLGMRRGEVLALLLARASLVSAAGSAVGVGLASLGLLLAARATDSGIFSRGYSAGVAAALVAVFIVAGMVGGALPAHAASRTSISAAMEDAP